MEKQHTIAYDSKCVSCGGGGKKKEKGREGRGWSTVDPNGSKGAAVEEKSLWLFDPFFHNTPNFH
jgi:hypothetical protein